MSLEDIQKKIVSDAEQKKEELLAEAKQNITSVVEHGEKLAQEYQEAMDKKTLSAAENLERGLVIDARRKLANEVLARKRKKMEQIFNKAKAEFIASSEYKKVMRELILQSTHSKKEEVLLGKNESVLDKSWLDEVNKSCSGSLSFSKDKGDFVGGLYLCEEQSFVNITVDTLFNLLREDVEKPVADMLFRG